ncbi:MAG TPA: biopolymer transporter ExbD [Desulfobacteraceae bacterium]|nr:biopolymer transporter ExbD [Desulfobacteraceae bacterium]
MKVTSHQNRRARIEMLPLIDIVFLLLAVFIYAMLSMSVHHGMPVNLPASETAAPETETILSVTVKSSSEIYVDHQRVTMEQLPGLLKQLSRQNTPDGVLLFAEKRLPYQVLFSVLDKIKLAGHTRISLQARSKVPGESR